MNKTHHSTFFSQSLVHILQECQYLMFLLLRIQDHRLNYTCRVFLVILFDVIRKWSVALSLINKLSWYDQTRHVNQHKIWLYSFQFKNKIVQSSDTYIPCFTEYVINDQVLVLASHEFYCKSWLILWSYLLSSTLSQCKGSRVHS